MRAYWHLGCVVVRRTAVVRLSLCLAAVALFYWWFTDPDDPNPLVDLDPTPSKLTPVVCRSHWMDTCYCRVNCLTGVPCEYPDEVDLRIIVMTYNRANSLERCLDHVFQLDTLGDKVAVEIWLDVTNQRQYHLYNAQVAERFAHNYTILAKKGRVCVHTHQRNAYISGQWMDSWRPKQGTQEMALILEDDVIVSPLAYKWLKMVHQKYGKTHRAQISGYTLTMETLNLFGTSKRPWVHPGNHSIFLYPVLGTNGYSPIPGFWRDFQDWYKQVRPTRDVKTDKIKPYVDDILPTLWYKKFEAKSYQESMWEMWHIKYTQITKTFTIYGNYQAYSKRSDALLCSNLKSKGLHSSGKSKQDNSKLLLKFWDKSFNSLPEMSDLIHYNYDGSLCSDRCCFNATCSGGTAVYASPVLGSLCTLLLLTVNYMVW